MLSPPALLAAELTKTDAAIITGLATVSSALVAGSIALSVAWVSQRREGTKMRREKLERLFLLVSEMADFHAECHQFIGDFQNCNTDEEKSAIFTADRSKKIFASSVTLEIGMLVDLYFPYLVPIKDEFLEAGVAVADALGDIRESADGADKVSSCIQRQNNCAGRLLAAILANSRALMKSRVRDLLPFGDEITARIWN